MNTPRTGVPERDRYAVIGNPIDHSWSPLIHAEFARATGQRVEYCKLLAPLDGFVASADAFRTAGGCGLNVTVPFKRDACAYVHHRSERAAHAGAVNAIRFDADTIVGENFDGVGLVRDVVLNLGCPIQGRRVLLLGAGGAARGALLPLLTERPVELVIADLEGGSAGELAEQARASCLTGTRVRASDYRDLANADFDIVLNATSASLRGEIPPLPVAAFNRCRLAYDLAYATAATPFLRMARNAGVPGLADGVGMLVEQAAEAFEWWRGVRPDGAGVIRRLRAQLEPEPIDPRMDR